MRVIYSTCYADPWIKVAHKLQKEHGYEPVYWNGYDDDDSENLVKKQFPNAIYQRYYDAWKGIFPEVIEKEFNQTYVDIDFLKDSAHYELQALLMMNRMDDLRHSFNLLERRRHFLKLVKYWTATIRILKPDVVISAIVPHRVYDYVLYLLCKHHGIKYITFRNSAFRGHIVPLTDVAEVKSIFDKDYEKYANQEKDNQFFLNQLEKQIIEKLEKVRKDYSIAEPDYMQQHVKSHKKSAGVFALAGKLFNDMSVYREKYFGKNGYLRKGIPTYIKEQNKSIENSHLSLVQYATHKVATNKYKNRLKKYYNKLVEEPDLTKPYIVLPLHYQPEMTSNPSGDIFTDQMLCVEMLAKNLPSGYQIYIKEHRSQFYAHTEGHSYRIKEFYDDLLSYPQVKLVSLDYDIFTLIKNSKAIATVTGTAGWEGMVLGKPVVIFGLSWYEKYKGVLKITDEESASKLTSFIENFSFSENNLLAYLTAFNKNSVKAYFYRGLKQKMDQSEEECVDNLTNIITEMEKNA
ncbi:MAG: hypothetical protein PF489_13065 [Salinivirgaceae bacterium]|jgi:hypothetical protein|nr:hypothetical protein [Salinivirgaceae bacterium]